MRVIIARHGYTFGPDQEGGERPVMCGCNQNLPLVQRGREKAILLANYFDKEGIVPTVFFANYLIRTWEHACILRDYYYFNYGRDIPLYQDHSLVEFDYGAWAGLVTEGSTAETNEVIARFGKQAWDDWQLKRKIPTGAPHHWEVSIQTITKRIQQFFTKLLKQFTEDDVVVAIASQGSMSFIHTLLPGGMEQAVKNHNLKTAPGNFCELVYARGEWTLIGWNVEPIVT